MTVYENHAQDSRVKPCGERLTQLNAQAGTGGCNIQLVVRFRGCLTPEHPQTHRVYGQGGAWPTVGANSGAGQNQQAVLTFGRTRALTPYGTRLGGNETDECAKTLARLDYKFPQCVVRRASGFKAGQSAKARSVGYGEESAASIGARMSATEPTVVTFVKRSHAKGSDGLGERLERSEVAQTQNAFDGGGDVRTQTVMLKLGGHIGFDSKGHLNGASRESSPTIRAGGFDRSHANGGTPPAVVAFRIDALASNSMRSRNPASGIRRVSAWPTIDTSSQSPTRNQGGAFVLKFGGGR